MVVSKKNKGIAVWAITPNGVELSMIIAREMEDALPHLNAKLNFGKRARAIRAAGEDAPDYCEFKILSVAVASLFNSYDGHIFIMSTGIVVRMIASLLKHKTEDPAVVVVDDRGRHCISLLSGHIGGGNALTEKVANILGATPVITTATDVNNVPAVDILAKGANLHIENPEAIKHINMAFLTGKRVRIHDPADLIRPLVPGKFVEKNVENFSFEDSGAGDVPEIYVSEHVAETGPMTLVLRPRTLVAGMGCNRNTPMAEMKELLFSVLGDRGLSPNSLDRIATVDIKCDEEGLLELADDLCLEMNFYTRDELGRVLEIETPSEMVEKHIGVKSVCEAAAILAAKRGRLIVPKKNTRNVTVALAVPHSTYSAWDRDTRTTCPKGPTTS